MGSIKVHGSIINVMVRMPGVLSVLGLNRGQKGKERCRLKKSRKKQSQENDARRGRSGFGGSSFGTAFGIGGVCGAALPPSMSTLAWNCRGLGNRRTVRALEKVVSSEDPNFIFFLWKQN